MTTADRVLERLHSYGLKREANGQYRSNSPLGSRALDQFSRSNADKHGILREDFVGQF